MKKTLEKELKSLIHNKKELEVITFFKGSTKIKTSVMLKYVPIKINLDDNINMILKFIHKLSKEVNYEHDYIVYKLDDTKNEIFLLPYSLKDSYNTYNRKSIRLSPITPYELKIKELNHIATLNDISLDGLSFTINSNDILRIKQNDNLYIQLNNFKLVGKVISIFKSNSEHKVGIELDENQNKRALIRFFIHEEKRIIMNFKKEDDGSNKETNVIKDEKVQVWMRKETVEYKNELKKLQIELLKLQNHVKDKGLKIMMLFEGRDAAGKGGTIKRITEHLNPRGARVVALEKPDEKEKSQWYFQRYIQHLPSAGEIVFFDRSWYNRAGVEPVMGFCTSNEHQEFLKEVADFENMLVKSGIILLKFYFSVSKEEPARRFLKRETDPLKQYKLSPVDKESQNLWDKYTLVKYSMLVASNTDISPWTIIRSDNKKHARLNCIKHILTNIEYPNKISSNQLKANPNILIDGSEEIAIMEQENKLSKV